MADRGYIPSSPECGQWETLLADALDGQLKPEDEATFTGHMAVCPACSALFEEARRGREWLEFLSPEPEVPAGLLDKILAQTGPGQIAGYGLVAEGGGAADMIQPWQHTGIAGHGRRSPWRVEPRLLMTAAMAFFSIALTLNLTGVRLNKLDWSDLRPGSVRSFVARRVAMASIPIIRYYDHLVFLYQVESRIRGMQGNPEGENQNPQSTQPAASGVSKGNSGQKSGSKDGGSRVSPPRRSIAPMGDVVGNYVETSLQLSNRPSNPAAKLRRLMPAHSSGSARAQRERSMTWTA